jgi:hypothetical protein
MILMSGIRFLGVILSLIGGAFLVINLLMEIDLIFTSGSANAIINWVIVLIIALMGVVGGLVGLNGKRAGGIFAVIGTTIAVVCVILFFITLIPIFNMTNYSFIIYLMTQMGFAQIWIYGLPFEVFLMLAGGILIIIFCEKKEK